MEYALGVHRSKTAAYKMAVKNGTLKHKTERNNIMACGGLEIKSKARIMTRTSSSSVAKQPVLRHSLP
jgi:hypothetical protein